MLCNPGRTPCTSEFRGRKTRNHRIYDRMADARRKLDWEAQWECAIDPETAKRIREERKPEHEDTCSMCGKFCAVRSMNKALAGEHIDIL